MIDINAAQGESYAEGLLKVRYVITYAVLLANKLLQYTLRGSPLISHNSTKVFVDVRKCLLMS